MATENEVTCTITQDTYHNILYKYVKTFIITQRHVLFLPPSLTGPSSLPHSLVPLLSFTHCPSPLPHSPVPLPS